MCLKDAGLLALVWVLDIAHKLAISHRTAVPLSMDKQVNVSLTVQVLTQTLSPMNNSFAVSESLHWWTNKI